MALESAYHGALAPVTRARRDGNRLTLSGDGVELVYELQRPEPDTGLVGTHWQLATIIQGATAANGSDFASFTMDFAADGTVTGDTACSLFSGAWAEAGGVITVTGVSSTARTCRSTAATTTESAVAAILTGGFSARIGGQRLAVEAEDGIGVEYRAAP